MLGAIIGDVVGSVYEFDNVKTKDFELFGVDNEFTDDTVMTVCVASALRKWNRQGSVEDFKETLIDTMHYIGNKYQDCGYGGHFLTWIVKQSRKPYNSWGNGSAMRVSPIGFFAKTLEEAKFLARASAEVSHNHPEGIKGAEATACAIFLARDGKSKEEIRKYIEDNYYKIDFTLDEIRPSYEFDVSCQGSVPQALECFFESNSFEDAIRNCVSIGGDCDTTGAICGGIAEAFYGIPEEIELTAVTYLDTLLLDEILEFKIFLSGGEI